MRCDWDLDILVYNGATRGFRLWSGIKGELLSVVYIEEDIKIY